VSADRTSRSPRREPLSIERITGAALALVDRDGLEALSMRKLGADLGYEAMALYKHVPDKEALIDRVVASVFAGMTLPEPDEPWPDRLRHSAAELRRVGLAHPHLLVRMVTNPPTALAVQERVDAILGALREACADDSEAVRWFWMFVSYTTGALLAESAAAREDSPLVPDELPSETCPVLAELGTQLAECRFGDEFAWGIEAIIDQVAG
jgi:TetR/AcrR family transcriptional regulator, tetracycline repressor protein